MYFCFMSFRSKVLVTATTLLCTLALSGFAQEAKATKAQKKAEKKKEQKIAKSRKADLKGKSRHYKLQDKKTRKRMKKHRKRVNQHYPGDRPGFFKRLFRKKHHYI